MDPARDKLSSDPRRPAYHFVAPGEWMNDPNGAVFWKGRYHLFYQYAPGFTRGDHLKHWGHAVSADLVHWEDLPVALSPTPGSCDEKGCWSGTGWNDGDKVVVVYHAHQSGNCIATSDDDLLVTWRKHHANPVIPPDPARVYDPCLWREGDTYYSLSGRITGAALGDGRDQASGGHDTAHLFQSPDLEHWQYAGALYEGGQFTEAGEDCACPDFFSIGGKHMLLFCSHNRGAQYYLGTWAEGRFLPEDHGRMNFTRPTVEGLCSSGDLIAPISWLDGKGRRIMIGWVAEGTTWECQLASGWAGMMTVPRLLSLGDDGLLRIEPVPELEVLRRHRRTFTDLSVSPDRPVLLEDIAGNCLEIAANIATGDATHAGLRVCRSPDGEEETSIFFDRKAQTLAIDVSRASLNQEMTGRESQRAPLSLSPDEPLELRVFVDRSIVEVFANGRQCVTKRIYPSRPDSLGVEFFAFGGTTRVHSVDTWTMDAIWPVR